jgi:hypothetical protein
MTNLGGCAAPGAANEASVIAENVAAKLPAPNDCSP